jgi:hypothetical protein
MVFVVFNCAKSSLMCQKSPKWMLSLCFKARHTFSMMKKHHSHHFQGREWCCSHLQSPPSCHPKQKSEGTEQKANSLTSKNFKIQKFQKHTHKLISGATYAPRSFISNPPPIDMSPTILTSHHSRRRHSYWSCYCH